MNPPVSNSGNTIQVGKLISLPSPPSGRIEAMEGEYIQTDCLVEFGCLFPASQKNHVAQT